MPPANTTAATATVMPTLPYSTTQDVYEAGTTYTVWYAVTATSDTNVIGAFAFGDLVGYQPWVTIWSGTPAALDPVPIEQGTSIAAQNRPVQFPVVTGTTYYLQIDTNGHFATSLLTLSVLAGAALPAPMGSLVVPDDANGFPAALIDATTGEILRWIYPFPGGEWGDVLGNGRVLVEDGYAIPHNTVALYSDQFAPLATIDPFGFDATALIIRVSRGLQVFYVGARKTGGDQLTTISSSGVQGPTWTMPAPSIGLGALAPTPDGTLVYVVGTSFNAPVKRFIPASSTFDTDLLAGRGAAVATFDLLVLGDNMVIVGDKDTGTGVVSVRRVSPAGTVLSTYTGVTSDGPAPKLAFDLEDPDYVWLWTHANNISTFHRIATATMTLARAITSREYEGGAYQGPATATPDQRFGNSFSCPFFLTRVAIGDDDGGDGGDGEPGVAYPIRRLRRAPHVNNENKRVFYRTFELDLERGQAAASGAGADPVVTLRFSRDGGFTWGVPVTMPVGTIGAYTQRVLARRLGHARDMVFEVTVTDPIAWSLVGAWLDLEPGTH